MPAGLTFVANVLEISLVFGTLGGALVLGGGWMPVLVNGGPVAHKNISTRCCRADNCFSAMGGRCFQMRVQRAVVSCAAASLNALAEDVFDIL